MSHPSPDTMHTAGQLDVFHLDILAQESRINRLYTQIIFCFELAHEASYADIVDRLTFGAERLSASFPWIAGTVVRKADTFKIQGASGTIPLIVKDLRDISPGWEDFRKANFPFSMLDENIVAPRRTLIASDEALPVFLIQANIISGGILLTFNGQHGSMDMAGQSQVIFLLAKACRNEPLSVSELSVGNMDRRDNIPLLSSAEFEAVREQAVHEADEEKHWSSQAKTSPPSLTWAYFNFSAASLSSLKSDATKSVPPGRFASTDDVLSAFVWQSITRARVSSLGFSPQLTTTLSRNVDVRHYLSMPSAYPGFLTGSTENTFTADILIHESLGTVAAQLRSALDGEALVRKIRVQATHIHSRDNTAIFAASSTPELDVRLSSWAREQCYDFDFGFGKPTAVRRPRFVEGAREGLVYFLPKTLEGEIVVGVCLRDEVLQSLKQDGEIGRYATYIG